MKRYAATIIFLLFPLLLWAAAGVADVEESDPGLFLMMISVLIAFGVMVLVGIVLSALLIGVIMLMVAMGIVTMSVLIGWYHRSLSKGVNTLFALAFTSGGAFVALLLLFVLYLWDIHLVASFTFCLSILIAGVFSGWVSLIVIKMVLRRILGSIKTN